MRHGRRNYDRNFAGLGMGRAQRYFVFGFEGTSDRLFDARKGAFSTQYCTRSSSTAMQYWTTRANYMKLPKCFNQLKRNEKELVLSHGYFSAQKLVGRTNTIKIIETRC
jgi:hypothetical protein